MTLVLLDTLLPIVVGLLLGYIAGRRRVMDNLNVQNLIVLVMDFAIPCALFSTSAAHPGLLSENNRNRQ
jgi:malonate transporter and related proteins